MKVSIIIASVILGISLLSGCGEEPPPPVIPKVSDYTKIATGEKVLLEPAKFKTGTIEDKTWKYFNAILKNNRKLASSLAAEYNKTDIAYDPGWQNLQRIYTEPDFDFKKKLYIEIDGKTKVKGNRYKGNSRIYGYSKKDKKEKSVEFSLTFADGTVKMAR